MLNNLQLANSCIDAYQKQTGASQDVEFLYVDDPDHHVFVIRGMESSKFFSGRGVIDFIRCLSVWPKPIGEAAGHAGFVGGWRAISSDVYDLIAEEPKKPVVFSGHSMGGIIAVIGAYTLIDQGYNVAKVVTFGAPRGLDLAYPDPRGVVTRLEDVTAQYEHPRDPVPGFLKWSRYHHVHTIFLEGYERAFWFNRKRDFHWMGIYRQMLIDDYDD